MIRRSLAIVILVLIGLCLFSAALYQIPAIHERLAWRLEALQADIRYALKPPEQAVFVPRAMTVMPSVTLTASTFLPTLTLTTTPSPFQAPTQPGPTGTPTRSPTPTISPTPLPTKTSLKGVVHEYQLWNNCGPANLAMALSFWDWQGDQRVAAAFLKPNQRDKNVMPYEMQAFVEEETDLKGVVRYAGDLHLLKTFLSAGFPVVVEKGFEGRGFEGWMGHYEVITAYDDTRQRFTAQDSYYGPDLPVAYADLEKSWRSFNFAYLVIYPAQRETEVLTILGPQADEITNYQSAAQKASDEIYALTDRDQYFAWYNRGSSLALLQDYGGAAQAYDQAFALYPQIPEKERPWRMLWYQTGPYFAYFGVQRYYDLIALATQTIDNANEPAIEESWYWRARAFYELYKLESKQEYYDHAVEDFQTSLKWHPDFNPTIYQLNLLGINP